MALGRDELQSGSVIAGYRIDEVVGRGGMGVVYRATNVALNRIYALKILTPELAEDEQFRERFKRETRIAASLHHPNIVGIHNAGEHEGLLFFVMDYVTGTDLHEILLKQGALPPARSVELLEQIASALDAAHARGLVHRDVKPANVLITVKDGEEHAYLSDFGLAKKFDGASAMTAKGLMVGTVDYMAPEQITGTRTDARTDVYGLGCVFFQMLSGRVPYERENSVATLFAHVHTPPPPLDGEIVETYPEFVPVLEKAMAKEPGDRYFSAGDFARDAAAGLKGMRSGAGPTIVGTGEAAPLVEAGETVVPVEPRETEPPVGADAPEDIPEPVGLETRISEPSPSAPAVAAAATQATSGSPPAEVPPAPTPVAGDDRRGGDAGKRSRGRFRLLGLAAVVLIAGAVVAVVLSSSGDSPKPAGEPLTSAAKPVPTNKVTGSGTATVRLDGNVVSVALDTDGLLNGSPHAMHFHAGGHGECPPASAANPHNGHETISTHDGINFYGPPQAALTSSGDTSPKSIIDFDRYPTSGNIRYKRKFTVPPGVAAAMRAGNTVVVVHGIDYNHNGIYDNVLDRSELKRSLPGEATAPALCGPLTAVRTTTAGRGRSAATTYAVVLHRYVGLPAAPVGDRPGLLCHLPGVKPTASA